MSIAFTKEAVATVPAGVRGHRVLLFPVFATQSFRHNHAKHNHQINTGEKLGKARLFLSAAISQCSRQQQARASIIAVPAICAMSLYPFVHFHNYDRAIDSKLECMAADLPGSSLLFLLQCKQLPAATTMIAKMSLLAITCLLLAGA